MLLIIEAPHVDKVRFSSVSGGKVVFEACLHTSDVPNRNGRVYPLDVMKEAVENIKPRLKEKTFGGELDHPLPTEDQYGSTMRHITLSLKEISHVFTDLWFEGNKLIGRGETLNTPNGKILANLILEGVHVGFSLRGFTENLRKEGKYDVVEPPLSLVSIDAVCTPSHEDAKLKRVLKLKEEELRDVSDPQVKTLLESFLKMRQGRTKRGYFFITSLKSDNIEF